MAGRAGFTEKKISNLKPESDFLRALCVETGFIVCVGK
jgi:hypothetical protein